MSASPAMPQSLTPDDLLALQQVPDCEQIDLLLPDMNGLLRGKRITRAYSISSPPDGNRFHLCLNLVADGLFSPLLFGAEPGFEVAMQGPLGTFTIRDPQAESILVATGTGVAPFRSMIGDYLRAGGQAPMTLLFGVRHEESLLYRADFEEWAARYPNFRFEPTLTQPGPAWKGRTGRVQPHLMEMVGDRRDLYDFLASRDARKQCPICSQEQWDGWDQRLALPRNIGEVDSGSLDVIPLICRNCGFVRLHSAHVLSDPRDQQTGSH